MILHGIFFVAMATNKLDLINTWERDRRNALVQKEEYDRKIAYSRFQNIKEKIKTIEEENREVERMDMRMEMELDEEDHRYRIESEESRAWFDFDGNKHAQAIKQHLDEFKKIEQLRGMRIETSSDVEEVLELISLHSIPNSEESRKIMSEILFDKLKGAVKTDIPERDLKKLGQEIISLNKQLEDSVRDVMWFPKLRYFKWHLIFYSNGEHNPVKLAGEIINEYPARKDEIVRMLLTQFLSFISNDSNLSRYLTMNPDLNLYTKILKLGINSDQKKEIGLAFLSKLKKPENLSIETKKKLGREILRIDPNLKEEVIEIIRASMPDSPYFKAVLDELMAAPAAQETAGKQ